MLKVYHTMSAQHKHNYVEGLFSLQQIWQLNFTSKSTT